MVSRQDLPDVALLSLLYRERKGDKEGGREGGRERERERGGEINKLSAFLRNSQIKKTHTHTYIHIHT